MKSSVVVIGVIFFCLNTPSAFARSSAGAMGGYAQAMRQDMFGRSLRMAELRGRMAEKADSIKQTRASGGDTARAERELAQMQTDHDQLGAQNAADQQTLDSLDANQRALCSGDGGSGCAQKCNGNNCKNGGGKGGGKGAMSPGMMMAVGAIGAAGLAAAGAAAAAGTSGGGGGTGIAQRQPTPTQLPAPLNLSSQLADTSAASAGPDLSALARAAVSRPTTPTVSTPTTVAAASTTMTSSGLAAALPTVGTSAVPTTTALSTTAVGRSRLLRAAKRAEPSFQTAP